MSDPTLNDRGSNEYNEMSDLIERLRDRYSKHSQELRDEAADEIERLNKEVDSLIELLRREKVKVERLRDSEGKWTKAAAQETAKALEYHDEIKRLRAALERIAELYYPAEIQRIAREALREVGDE